MTDSSTEPWSDNPDAPKIPYFVYVAEKANFSGLLAGAISYGVVVVLFLQCMGALLDRTRGEIRWPLVAHTSAMFSFVTVFTAMNFHIQSISNIDNRGFPGSDVLVPGPLGYQLSIYSHVINLIPFVMFFLNQWLADGLLLYRCYIIYAMNYWVIALPSVMYLASVALGIMLVYAESSRPYHTSGAININLGTPCYSISLALNVLLTLMIVTRLILHSQDVQNTIGDLGTVSGLYKAVVTMLIESCALYAISFILFIGPWGAHSPLQFTFLPILAEIQVIAPFLIILRVANRSALKSDTITSATIGSIHFRSQENSIGVDTTIPDGHPVCSTDTPA